MALSAQEAENVRASINLFKSQLDQGFKTGKPVSQLEIARQQFRQKFSFGKSVPIKTAPVVQQQVEQPQQQQQQVEIQQEPVISTTTTATTTGTKFGERYKYLTEREKERSYFSAAASQASSLPFRKKIIPGTYAAIGGLAGGVYEKGIRTADQPVKEVKKTISGAKAFFDPFDPSKRREFAFNLAASFKEKPIETTAGFIIPTLLFSGAGRVAGKLPIKNVVESRTLVSPELAQAGEYKLFETLSKSESRGRLFGVPVTPKRSGFAGSDISVRPATQDLFYFKEDGVGVTRGRLGTTPKVFDFEAVGETRQIGTEIYKTRAATKFVQAGKKQEAVSVATSGLRYENELLGKQFLTRGEFGKAGKRGEILKPSKFQDLSINLEGGILSKEGGGISALRSTGKKTGKPLDFEYLRPTGQPSEIQIARPADLRDVAKAATQTKAIAAREAQLKTQADITGLQTKAKTLSSVVGYNLGLGAVEYQQARQKPGQPTIRQQRYENAITGFAPLVQLPQQKQREEYLYANALLPKTKQRSTQAFLQAPTELELTGQITTPIQLQIPKTTQATQQQTRQTQRELFGFVTPNVPRVTQPYKFFYPLKVPYFSSIGEGYLQRGRSRKAMEKYQASLVGLVSGLTTTKAPKSLTGLEVRYPVAFGGGKGGHGGKRRTRPLYLLRRGRSDPTIKGVLRQFLTKTRRKG